MLNELAVVSESLRQFGVQPPEPHPWVKPLARTDRLVIRLDAQGMPALVELLPREKASSISHVYKSNHQIFPGTNWPCPVVALQQEDPGVRAWLSTPVADTLPRIARLREAVEDAPVARQQREALLHAKAFCAELQPAFAGECGGFAAFPELIRRILGVGADREAWFRRLVLAAIRAAESSPALLPLAETLIGGLDPKKGRLGAGKVPVFFDLADCTAFPVRVADREMAPFLSERLAAITEAGAEGTCAITGCRTGLEDDKLPSPKLPLLGNTYLMSMNADEPCQFRYGRSSVQICPIGRDTASRLNASLLFLTAADRKGRTWNPVPGPRKGTLHLLLAYLQADPKCDVALASLFTEPDEASENYAGLCGSVCQALRARPAGFSETVQVFVLNRIDKGRVQVELSNAFTAAQIVEGAEEWQHAALDLPPLGLLAPASAPTPAAVMEALQSVWIRGGEKAADAPGCNLRDVFNLLVAGVEGARDSARGVLSLIVSRSLPLLLAAGHHMHRSERFPDKRVGPAARACSVLAIALYKLGHRKDTYMSEPAFLLGRFLSLADTLHREYCVGVRKDKLPPQLLGNSLMPAALVNPERGLARMQQRLRVYQAWATRSDNRLARWALGEMGAIASELAQAPLPTRMDDAAKAQLLLGYLARAEKKEEEEQTQKGEEQS
jgi:hypothetical protein